MVNCSSLEETGGKARRKEYDDPLYSLPNVNMILLQYETCFGKYILS